MLLYFVDVISSVSVKEITVDNVGGLIQSVEAFKSKV